MEHKLQFSKLELMQGRVDFIPEGWNFIHLNKAFKIRNNLRLPINSDDRQKDPGSYPYYGPTKIQGHIGSYQQDGEYALIGEDGDHFLKYKTNKMTQLVNGKCTVNNHAHIIEGTKKATREWFYYYFMHRDIFSFLTRQGAGRYKLNKAALEKLPVLIPPVDEQKKISKILLTWDKAIAITEQLLTNSQQQKKALMQQLLTGNKRLPSFNGEWKFGTFNELFLVANDKKTQVKSSEYLEAGNTPIVDQGKKMVSGFTNNCHIYSNVPVIIFGDHTRVVKWVDFSFAQGADGTQVLKTKDILISKYGYYLMDNTKIQSLGYSRHMRELKVKDFKYPFDLKEQKQITLFLSNADKEIEVVQKKVDCLMLEKKALMQQLLTGKRRVKIDKDIQ